MIEDIVCCLSSQMENVLCVCVLEGILKESQSFWTSWKTSLFVNCTDGSVIVVFTLE